MTMRIFQLAAIRNTPARLRRLAPLLMLAAAGCGGSGGSATPTTPGTPGTPGTPATPVVTTSVSMQSTAFNPTAIQVSPGATVTFTNSDGYNHTVTFSSAAITSLDAFPTGAKTIVMPTAAGTYPYRCTIHSGMNGSVVVQ